ncbi:MAG: helix-turn-helix domain-containing protein [Candidatus Nezhaarchaeota archaeon]|nr:helix-turn-helix domain-containing protein [Candidatus Nezhaarchaeota archaeon]
MVRHGAFLSVGGGVAPPRILYSLIVPDSFKATLEDLNEAEFKVAVRRLSKFRCRKELLTKAQERALWLPLKAGFFEYPRRVGTQELAFQLGVSKAAFSDVRRRCLKALLEDYFEH